MKKLPSTLEESELLSIIEDKENLEPLEKAPEHSVIQFLADFGIYPGINKISGRVLYKLYMNATENYVIAQEFHLLLKGYIEYTENNNKIVYYLNKEAEDLTLQLAEFLKKKKTLKKLSNRNYRLHFESFIKAHKLKPGQGRIPAMALYYLYDKWQYNRKDKKIKTVLNYHNFIGMIKIYFKVVQTKFFKVVVKIDREFFKQYTEEEINIALNWAVKFNEKRYNKKIKPTKDEKQTF